MFDNITVFELIIIYIITIYSLVVTAILFYTYRKYRITEKELINHNKKHSHLQEILNFINKTYSNNDDYLLDKELDLIKKIRSLSKKEKEQIIRDIDKFI